MSPSHRRGSVWLSKVPLCIYTAFSHLVWLNSLAVVSKHERADVSVCATLISLGVYPGVIQLHCTVICFQFPENLLPGFHRETTLGFPGCVCVYSWDLKLGSNCAHPRQVLFH